MYDISVTGHNCIIKCSLYGLHVTSISYRSQLVFGHRYAHFCWLSLLQSRLFSVGSHSYLNMILGYWWLRRTQLISQCSWSGNLVRFCWSPLEQFVSKVYVILTGNYFILAETGDVISRLRIGKFRRDNVQLRLYTSSLWTVCRPVGQQWCFTETCCLHT